MGRRKVLHSGQGQDMFRGGARVIMIDLVQRSVLDDDDDDDRLWGNICERSGVDVVGFCWRGVGVGCTKKLELDFEGRTI
jgi:hypothetical protein